MLLVTNSCYWVGDAHSTDYRLSFSHHCTPDTTINDKAKEHLLTNNIFKYKKNDVHLKKLHPFSLYKLI